MERMGSGGPTHVGPFEVVGVLGQGGMGRVLLAAGPDGRLVAVKQVLAHFADDEAFRARFRREVTASRKVSGAYTAAVIDADPDASTPWLASVFVAGPALGAVVKAVGVLPEDVVRRLAAGLTSALAEIHRAGLVHRDLKPDNVLLAEDGVRVIDLGIARVTEGESEGETGLTRTGWVVGSPAYMSPEQAEGKPLTPASDVFSLGSVLALAATGRSPFAGSSTLRTLYDVVHGEPDLSDLPAGLRDLVARCLAKDPEARPSPAQLRELIGPVTRRAVSGRPPCTGCSPHSGGDRRAPRRRPGPRRGTLARSGTRTCAEAEPEPVPEPVPEHVPESAPVFEPEPKPGPAPTPTPVPVPVPKDDSAVVSEQDATPPPLPEVPPLSPRPAERPTAPSPQPRSPWRRPPPDRGPGGGRGPAGGRHRGGGVRTGPDERLRRLHGASHLRGGRRHHAVEASGVLARHALRGGLGVRTGCTWNGIAKTAAPRALVRWELSLGGDATRNAGAQRARFRVDAAGKSTEPGLDFGTESCWGGASTDWTCVLAVREGNLSVWVGLDESQYTTSACQEKARAVARAALKAAPRR
ncbi:serine/threonine-protein kinase [Streptomyces sp. MS1.HAVA.3]|uniref:Serine/threonine-protein kinase n=1 Tax=Streptomyces caledonius TaxID=3134107 RepID=A0ABU8UBP1_9ACTN